MTSLERVVDAETPIRRIQAYDDAITRRVRIAAWCLLPLTGLIRAMAGRHNMQDDGISYLDMGDAMMRGDWKAAVSGVWSPLYPFVQGLALKITHPSAYSQFTVVHIVNFLIYLLALAGFENFLAAARPDFPTGNCRTNRVPRWLLYGVGYAVFFWTSLGIVGLELVLPDLLMAAFLYLAMGLLLRIWADPRGYSKFLFLGFVLGLGYLTKAPVFLLGFIFFAVSWIVAGRSMQVVPRVLAGLAVFLAVCSPWIVGLSHAMGHFTFGDSARFNYVHHVNRATSVNLGTAGGQYTHPVRLLFDNPPIYEFATPIKGTSPIWYDPSYWSAGAVPRVHLHEQWAIVRRWGLFYLKSFLETQMALCAGFLLMALAVRRHVFWGQLLARWPVWLISSIGIGMYIPVHLELRYVAGFIAMFWVAFFAGLETSPQSGMRLAAVVTVVVALVTGASTAFFTANDLRHVLRGQPHKQWRVARDLQNLGVKPGDRVARLPAHFGLAWARLLGVRSVAEVDPLSARQFWCQTPETREQAIEKLGALGITAFVAEQGNEQCPPGPEWHHVGDGAYYALIFQPGKQ